MQKYTREFLISEFWRFYKENNRYPLSIEMKAKNGYPSYDAYKNYWKSWSDLLDELNLLGDIGWYKCDEEVIKQLYSCGSQEEILNKLMVKRKWGQIKNKAASMGINRDKSKIRRIFSDAFLIKELKRFYEEFQYEPTYKEFEENNNFPSATVYKKRFGSWNKSLILAGLKVNTIWNHNKDAIINDVVNFYKENHRSPFYNELPYSQTIIRQYWDTWNDLLVESGVPINIRTRANLTKKKGLEILLNFKQEYGKNPTASEIERLGIVNKGWFREKFGSFDNALLKAGLLKEEDIISKDEWVQNSIDGLEFLSRKFNRPPSATEYDKYARKNKLLNRKALENNLNKRYSEICESILGKSNSVGFGLQSYDKNGDVCLSVSEMIISNILIDNNIDYIKEFSYKYILNNENDKRRTDWYLTSYHIVVEYFGLYNESEINNDSLIGSYTRDANKKIIDCDNHNVEIIALFPNDIYDNTNGLLEKFLNHGFDLKISN